MRKALMFGLACTLVCVHVVCAFGWSNGGFSSDPLHPKYGTHDWIAQRALDWLPLQDKQFILDHLTAYLYGTELPDNSVASDGVGDTAKHHVYYRSDGCLQDDASAVRAQQEFDEALRCAKAGDLAGAAKTLGMMTHYIADVGVFGHVMGSKTDWGDEVHHEDYEDHVETSTNSYDGDFSSYLRFDGTLDKVSAYNATLTFAYNTTFGDDGKYNCSWMDQNCDWNNLAFRSRCGESLNLAVNLVADVLHAFSTETTVPEYPQEAVLALLVVLTLAVALCAEARRKASGR